MVHVSADPLLHSATAGNRKLSIRSMKSIVSPTLATRIWILTGDPAIGKSTALSRILLELRKKGYVPGGVIAREIRSHGEREGFQLVDISSDETEILAAVKGITGPRIGKYKVNLRALSTLGVEAVEKAVTKSDVIAIDEIGPMELLSPEFRRAIRFGTLETRETPAVCVMHKRFQDPLIDELRNSPEVTEEEVTFENRNELPVDVAKNIIRYLERKTART